MGVYIKGIEMPKNCDKCIYSAWSNFYQIYVCNAVRKNEPALFDGKQTKSTAVARSARADNCPLIPVPPHGRLIDADALENEAQMRLLECNKYDNQFQKPYEVMRAIALAPTIIPTSEEGNEK